MTVPNNKHIEEFLDYYCESKEELNYAVMLKGAWGSGKTYFMKDYVSKKGKQSKFLHLSLYGISSFLELDDLILSEVVGKKHLSKWFVKVFKQVELPKLKEYFKFKGAEKIILKRLLKDGYILIFDDLERCKISMDELLGYINSFVEFQNKKVILIANEDEISEAEAEKYKKIKEKLVGKTFEVVPLFDEAFEYFLNKFKDIAYKKFLTENRDLIFGIYAKSQYNNIRVTITSLFNFERLFKIFSSEVKKNTEIMRQIFRVFLIFSIESKKGRFSLCDLEELKNFEVLKLANRTKEVPAEKIDFTKKYDNFSFYEIILSPINWINILDGNIIDKESINKDLKLFISNENETWQKLWDMWKQTDDEFEENLKDVRAKFEAKKYQDIGVVLHVLSRFIRFSKEGLIETTLEDLVQVGKDYIDYLFEKKLLEKEMDRHGWGGLGFPEPKDDDEFQKIFDYLREKQLQVEIIEREEFGEKLLKQTLDKDPEKVGRILGFIKHDSRAQQPICANWKADIFVDKFCKTSPQIRKTLIMGIEERYKMLGHYECLTEEKTFLLGLEKALKARTKKQKGKLSSFHLNAFLSTGVIPSIKRINKFSKKTKQNEITN